MSQTMRRFDRQISMQEAQDLLKTCEYGTLSTIGPDGLPYAIPMCYAWDGDAVFFHGTAEGSKFGALSSCGVATFSVVGRTQVLPESFAIDYESAIVTGPVTEVRGDAKRDALMRFICKYSPGYEAPGAEYIDRAIANVTVYRLQIQTLTGKARRSNHI